MATTSFNLKNPKAKGESLIYFSFYYGTGQKIVLSSGKKIKPEYWQGDKTKVGCYRARKTKAFPNHPEFNKYLDELERKAKELFTKYQNENDIAPSISDFKQILRNHLFGLKKPKEEPKNKNQSITFYKATDELIMKSESGKRLNERSGTIAPNTIRGYKDTLSAIKKKWPTLNFDDITLEFYENFRDYMEKKNVTNNTFGKHIKNIKVFMGYAVDSGYTNNLEFKSKKFKVIYEETDSIALTESDVQKLFDLNLQNYKRLEKVRDLFVLMCMTGLRISDIKKLNESHIDREKELIHIKAQKTDERVTIPLLDMANSVIEKYTIKGRGLALKLIADQKMNEYIKEVGNMIDSFQTPIKLFTGTKKGKRIIKNTTIADELKNHVGRRTFCTIMYRKGISAYTIMAISGHKTEKSFLRYIKVSSTEHAEKLRQGFEDYQNKN